MIKKCECSSQYQDEKYGAGLRVYNATKKGARCTVCGKEWVRPAGAAKAEK